MCSSKPLAWQSWASWVVSFCWEILLSTALGSSSSVSYGPIETTKESPGRVEASTVSANGELNQMGGAGHGGPSWGSSLRVVTELQLEVHADWEQPQQALSGGWTGTDSSVWEQKAASTVGQAACELAKAKVLVWPEAIAGGQQWRHSMARRLSNKA